MKCWCRPSKKTVDRNGKDSNFHAELSEASLQVIVAALSLLSIVDPTLGAQRPQVLHHLRIAAPEVVSDNVIRPPSTLISWVLEFKSRSLTLLGRWPAAGSRAHVSAMERA